jgi:hypothetical protein
MIKNLNYEGTLTLECALSSLLMNGIPDYRVINENLQYIKDNLIM